MDSAAADVVQPISTMAPGPLQPVDEGSRALRFRLFLLAASGLAPLALVLFLASAYLAQERRTDTQRSALELSRALATAVDAELGSTVSLLENLAISSDLQDIAPARLATEDFSRLAQRMAQSQKWMMIVVADERGDVVAREGPVAAAAHSTVEPESLAQVMSTRAPAVGRAAKEPGGAAAFAVRIPVVKDGRLRYVLSAVASTDRIHDVVARRQVTPSWVAAVYDQGGNVVASSRAADALRYPASLADLVKASGEEGAGITRTAEGVETYTGFSRVRSSQWVVAVGIPADAANADLRRVIAAVGAGTAASLALLALLAWRMASGISGPIDILKRAAADLGAGKSVTLRPLGVEELDEVGWALRQAAIDRDDANERRGKVEAEREHLLVQLEEALHVAEQANRNKDEFLALLGHELRNPLAPILNAVHLMGLKDDDDRTLPERRIIQRQLSYVRRMVDDLLDASRITSNRFAINLRPLRVVPVLEQTVEAQRPNFGSRTVNLRIDDAARGEWVRADEARLVQIFNNILGNAIKFTAPTGTIDLEARKAGRSIEIVFRDDGAGMSAENLRHAFDLFWQAPHRAPGASAGLGLGLAIVRSLVEMHAGTVQAHSDGAGHGMVIIITLPVGEPPIEDATFPRMSAGAAGARVLVVDDNEDAADTLSMLLNATGFVVRVAYTPQSALDAVASFQPEIVLMDIGLPDMDGYEVARRLRSGDRPFQGRLVALTGYGQDRDVRRAHDAGFDAHLTKPVEPETLFQLLARLAAASRPRA